jgi:hypothetical protein
MKQKKADVAENPEVFHHVGLLNNATPGRTRVALYQVIRNDAGLREKSRPSAPCSNSNNPVRKYKCLGVLFRVVPERRFQTGFFEGWGRGFRFAPTPATPCGSGF